MRSTPRRRTGRARDAQARAAPFFRGSGKEVTSRKQAIAIGLMRRARRAESTEESAGGRKKKTGGTSGRPLPAAARRRSKRTTGGRKSTS